MGATFNIKYNGKTYLISDIDIIDMDVIERFNEYGITDYDAIKYTLVRNEGKFITYSEFITTLENDLNEIFALPINNPESCLGEMDRFRVLKRYINDVRERKIFTDGHMSFNYSDRSATRHPNETIKAIISRLLYKIHPSERFEYEINMSNNIDGIRKKSINEMVLSIDLIKYDDLLKLLWMFLDDDTALRYSIINSSSEHNNLFISVIGELSRRVLDEHNIGAHEFPTHIINSLLNHMEDYEASEHGSIDDYIRGDKSKRFRKQFDKIGKFFYKYSKCRSDRVGNGLPLYNARNVHSAITKGFVPEVLQPFLDREYDVTEGLKLVIDFLASFDISSLLPHNREDYWDDCEHYIISRTKFVWLDIVKPMFANNKALSEYINGYYIKDQLERITL